LKGVILGSTIAEKILARASGQVRVNAGDNIQAKPDFVVAYDFPGYTDVIFKQMKDEFGLTGVKDPSRYALFIDHMVPAVTPQDEELHQNTRDWGALNHVPVYERKGIGIKWPRSLGMQPLGHSWFTLTATYRSWAHLAPWPWACAGI
jgi:3-isopropylmalate/(R)-2-methylmalate dehydratase large subunit